MPRPELVFGTANFGFSDTLGTGIKDTPTFQSFLDYFKKNGIKQLDTARIYANGTSEEIIAAVKASEQGFLIDTKVKSFTKGDHTPENLRASVKASLDALKTKKIHILYLHAPDRSVSLESVLKTLTEIHAEGAFEKLGLSNYTTAEVKEIIRLSNEKNYIRPSVYQGLYNIFSRNNESDLFPLLKKEKISFYAYSPLLSGLLNYRNQADATNNPNSRYNNAFMQQLYGGQYFKPSILKALEKLHEISEKFHFTANEIALRWIFHHSQLNAEDGDAIIIGASKISQVESNLKDFQAGPLPQEISDFLEKSWKEISVDAPKEDWNVTQRNL
eukprot:TRINITY_DN2925_c0_g2_i2.p1 TRINITY_DN2925_c0_g2~~TRINITY_DN2925_c0_g2_i2.p1  ORF type:complete len:330 (+),score=126.69 TRINITY_DN2925_c0_g2_i2:110-1099(+)